MRVGITGANGYVGGILAQGCKDRGHQVTALVRHPEQVRLGPLFGAAIAFDLEAGVDVARLGQLEAIVHCAHDFSSPHPRVQNQRNVAGSLHLLQCAQKAKVERFLFISSMSAFPGCRSLYGQMKLAVERAVLAEGGMVVRPGLIFGDPLGGMMQALDKLVGRLPLVPLVGLGKNSLYLCHDRDLQELVNWLLLHGAPEPRPLLAAASEAMTLKQILTRLGQIRHKTPHFVPIPSALIYGLLKLPEALGLQFRIRSDGLVGLLHQDPQPCFDLPAAGLAFRAFF